VKFIKKRILKIYFIPWLALDRRESLVVVVVVVVDGGAWQGKG
jgi:hypothetical protein